MIDKSKLENILKLDDNTLKNKIEDALACPELYGQQVNISSSDINTLRQKVSSLSNQDLEKIIASIGRENAEIIAKKLSSK